MNSTTPGSTTRRTDQTSSLLLYLVFSVTCGGCGLVLLYDAAAGQLVSGLSCMVVGASIFIEHGGPRITAAGLYGLATAVFAGGVSLYWWIEATSSTDGGQMGLITFVALITLCIQYLLFWRSYRLTQTPPANASRIALQGTLTWGSILLVTLLALRPLIGDKGIHFSAGGMALVMCVLLLGRNTGASRLIRLTGAVLTVLAFYELAFTGFGRLILVTLALTGAVVFTSRVRTRLTKALMVALILPILGLLIALRETQTAMATGEKLDGMGSIVNPFRDLELLYVYGQSGSLSFGYGSSFIESALFWVPRSLWPAKPPGFGTVLTEIFHPELLSVGHSMAALHLGEWYYNFGALGWALIIPGLGLLIRFIDLRLIATIRIGTLHRVSDVLRLVIWATLSAEIPSLVWVGTFTYLSRGVQRVAPLLALYLLVTFLAETRRPPRQRAIGADSGRSDTASRSS